MQFYAEFECGNFLGASKLPENIIEGNLQWRKLSASDVPDSTTIQQQAVWVKEDCLGM